MTENRIEQVENGLSSKLDSDTNEQRTSSLARRMAETHVPGVSIAVFGDGKIAWAKGYGLRARGELWIGR